ncbi:MAG: hypothetical protein H6700_05325 [Myxococcales bacterium]|nr:hypothetical protein [Myxococcales bacterium]MCB9531168.1 hypothetical protein [Myxococcales bacterium]
MLRLAPVAALLALAFSACGSVEGTEPDGSVDAGGDSTDPAVGPVLQIGTGFPELEPLVCGQDVPIIQGIQGGYHVWGGFAATGLEPGTMAIDFGLDVGGVEVASASYEDSPVAIDGRIDYAGVAVILHADQDPDALSGTAATLRVTVVDSTGASASDSVEIVPICCSR